MQMIYAHCRRVIRSVDIMFINLNGRIFIFILLLGKKKRYMQAISTKVIIKGHMSTITQIQWVDGWGKGTKENFTFYDKRVDSGISI